MSRASDLQSKIWKSGSFAAHFHFGTPRGIPPEPLEPGRFAGVGSSGPCVRRGRQPPIAPVAEQQQAHGGQAEADRRLRGPAGRVSRLGVSRAASRLVLSAQPLAELFLGDGVLQSSIRGPPETQPTEEIWVGKALEKSAVRCMSC